MAMGMQEVHEGVNLGLKPVGGKRKQQEGVREKFSCDIVSVKPSANPTRNSKDDDPVEFF